jgi:hypothetical protein
MSLLPLAGMLLTGGAWCGAAVLPDAKPVPAMQAVPLPYAQVSLQRDGRELCRYHFGAGLKRPFVFPVVGPSGRSLTRMGHPHDPVTHSHHNSVWVSHNDVAGVSFWGDRGKGTIVHRSVEGLADGADEASVTVQNEWRRDDGTVLLRERRRVLVVALPDGEWLLVLDLSLAPPARAVTFGKTPFGLVGVRVAKSLGVHDGGGLLRNSAGGVNEKAVLWKRARWVDYAGQIAPGSVEGLTLMDHPDNPGHPTVFHVRNDGWMGASLTFGGPRTVEPDSPLRVRYGLYVHRGVPSIEAIDARWKAFTKLKPWPAGENG